MILSHPAGQGAMAAVAAAAVAIQGTLAVPGALDSRLIIIINRIPVTRGARHLRPRSPKVQS